ncbi:MAG: T9SS type A sorting domain-containing protein [Bacteroidales bacterium]|nr:T9SS type A sorting domain-containing protein [Bacteroidales bacterium]
MKRAHLLTAAFLLMGMLIGSQANAQGRIELGRAQSAQECANVTDAGFTASFSFSSIDAADLNTEKGVFSTLTMPGTYPSGNVGEPSLPAAHQLIALPYGAKNVTVEVKNYSTTTYRLADFGIKTIAPQQPSLRKDQKPEDVKFFYNEQAYASRTTSTRPVAEFEIQGNMRGISVGSLNVNPVNYNPAENTITVYNDIELEVRYNDYDKAAAENEFARTFSPYFAGIYKTMFNWRDDIYDQHPDLWQAPVKMLVIANRMFEDCMQDWLAWKTMKGYYVDLNFTDEIGTTAAAIQSFIQNKYAEEAPTFVIIFGDKEQVPGSATGSQSQKITDLYYMTVDGDNYPDIFHSRMCAQTVEQMQNIITKTLWYEKLQFENQTRNTDYLNNVLLIAGWDSYWTAYDGAPTIQYAMEYYYNAEHGFNQVNHWLGQPYTGCYASLNTGVGFANYTAHGSETGWADPSLSVSDVNNFTNEGMPFLAMGNCCLAADWGYSSTCFGEAMIRANTRGAYAYIGSCPSTYWYEDYYFGVGATNVFGQMPTYEQTAYGVYDAIWDDDVFNTVSAIPFIGNIAVAYSHANGYQGSVNDLYYWQSYHVLGDGSVIPFRVEPTYNTVNHLPTLPIGLDSYTVSADAGSYVGISKDGVLYGAGLIGEEGTADIQIEPITSGGDVTICVTHPNRRPYIAVVPAAAMNGAYVSVDAYTPANAHVGDQSSMNITVKNVGTQPTSGTTNVTLTCDNPNLTIINGTASFGALAPDATVELTGFTYNIAQGVADGTRFTIMVNAVCGNDTWEGKVYVTAGEAVLEYGGIALGGGFVPGETLTLTAAFKNAGHYMATNAIASIASANEYVSFENATYEVGTIDPSGVGYCVFNVTVAANCPETEQIPLTFTLNADGGLVAEGSGVLKNSCNVVFELSDSYGDGWNGASLHVNFSDGTPSQTMTINSGNSQVYTVEIGNSVQVSMTWTSGSWDSECSFIIRYEDGDVIYQSSGLGSSWSHQFTCDCGGGTASAYSPVENLTAALQVNAVTLDWTAPAGAVSYSITRNGIALGETTEANFTDQVLNEMVYTYCVTAVYADGGVSAPECVQVDFTTGVEENLDQVSIYPNPVNSTLNIEGGNAEFSYVMYNGMGQMVANGTANGNTQINVSGMAEGIYFLRLTTGTQVRIEKVIVK